MNNRLLILIELSVSFILCLSTHHVYASFIPVMIAILLLNINSKKVEITNPQKDISLINTLLNANLVDKKKVVYVNATNHFSNLYTHASDIPNSLLLGNIEIKLEGQIKANETIEKFFATRHKIHANKSITPDPALTHYLASLRMASITKN